VISTSEARFLDQDDQVEGVDDDGIHVESRGSSNHRREELAGEARVSVFPSMKKRNGEI
jgi:hypothetical protein